MSFGSQGSGDNGAVDEADYQLLSNQQNESCPPDAQISRRLSSHVAKPGGDMFFSRCTRNPCCFGLCWGRWKSEFDSAVCCLSGLLVFALFFGTIAPLVIDRLVNEEIDKTVIIDSTSAASFDTWASNVPGSPGDSVDIGYNIYFFDLQNPDEILQGEKPIVVERGPYAFHEYFDKFDIEFSEHGDHVSFNTYKFYTFDPEKTGPGLSLDDDVMIPYATVLGFQYLLDTIPVESQELLDVALDELVNKVIDGADVALEGAIKLIGDSGLPQKKKDELIASMQGLEAGLEVVREDLVKFVDDTNIGYALMKVLMCASPSGVSPFRATKPVDGYFGWLKDPILVEVANLLKLIDPTIPWSTAVPGISNNYTSREDARRRKSPDTMKTGRHNVRDISQYIRSGNMTTQYVCLNSMDSPQSADFVEGDMFPACAHFQHEWTHEEATERGYVLAFKTDYANRIAGTDATMFGRPSDTDKVQVYVSDIYRTVFLEHSTDVFDWHDVKLRRYVIQTKDLFNASMNPVAADYYLFGPSGMENMTAATGVPLFATKPHFLDGSPSLVANIIGLNPTQDAHGIYLDVEPITGLLARAHKRLQVAYEMTPMRLPEMTQASADAVEELCTTVSPFLDVTCNGLDSLMQCLAEPSDWKIRNDALYVPYAWVDEYMTASEDDADSIKNGIYASEDLSADFMLWSYVVAGLCFTALVGMYASKWFHEHKLARKYGKDDNFY